MLHSALVFHSYAIPHPHLPSQTKNKCQQLYMLKVSFLFSARYAHFHFERHTRTAFSTFCTRAKWKRKIPKQGITNWNNRSAIEKRNFSLTKTNVWKANETKQSRFLIICVSVCLRLQVLMLTGTVHSISLRMNIIQVKHTLCALYAVIGCYVHNSHEIVEMAFVADFQPKRNAQHTHTHTHTQNVPS